MKKLNYRSTGEEKVSNATRRLKEEEEEEEKTSTEYIFVVTLKVGKGDGVSILGLLNAGSLLPFFAADPESRTSSLLLY